MRSAASIACAIASLAAGLAVHADPGPVVLTPITTGLASPVAIAHARDGSGRLFVLEQGGRVRVVRASGALEPLPFLDIAPDVQSGGEEGLLGIAFHPAYAANGRFFVYYTHPAASPEAGGNIVTVERFNRSAADPDRADIASRAGVLAITHQTFGNHNGGALAFGPDGLLYAGVGDGGGGGDPFRVAQSLADLRGKILRIDVNAEPYAVPPSNPFVATPGARPEIFAYGLRNPWRLTFDRATGDIFIGEVGQNAREEIDFIAAGSPGGQNFGWRIFEGTACFDPPSGCALEGHVPPILDYPHDFATGGFSVTGGYRYRGRSFPELRGHYVYADYVSGHVWAALPLAGGGWSTTVVANAATPSSFGEDEAGELYVTDHQGGRILRLGPPDADGDGMSDAFEAAHFGAATAGNPIADADGDGLAALHEYREGRNPGAKDNDVFGDARLFALQQYRDFLAREADAPGAEFWTRHVETRAQGRTDAVERFIGSPEFEGAIAPVARLYFAYFLRIPDYDGLNHWIGRFRAGLTLEQVSQQFATSPEFTNRYGALSDGAFVDRVYRNVLGRAPDAGGLAFWTGRLQRGEMTRGEVMTAFSESAEYRPTIHSEVYVTMLYVGMLRRSPEQGGFDFWVGHLDGGETARGLIESFIAAPEYRARFLP